MASNEEERDTGSLNPSDGGSWWQSWGKSLVDTVKEKTSSTYEMVQKDLSEFYQTIQNDTAHVVADTATKVQDQIKITDDENCADCSKQSSIKQGFASILTSVSESLKTLAHEESPLPSKTVGESSAASPVYDRRQAKIYQIQTEVGTYCNEPEGTRQDFQCWLKDFDFDAKRTEMSELLVKIPEIRSIYSKVVPSAVSHATFWQRYFYKIYQFELGEERRAALVARAETASLHEEELNWDSDDGDDICEASEVKLDSNVMKSGALNEDGAKADAMKTDTTFVETDKTRDESTGIGTESSSMDDQSQEDMLKGDRVLQDATEEPSFEILSPSNSKQTDKESCVLRALPPNKNKTDGSANDVGNSSLSSSWSRSSPAKEDSSPNCLVEVVENTTDNADRSIAKRLENATVEQNRDQLHSRGCEEARADHSETASTGSWISVDDEIKVRKSKHEKFISDKGSDLDLTKSPASNRNSDSSSSSAVLVEKSDCKTLEDDDNDDVDIDLDEDISEEELKKIMEKIKSKSGDLDDDNDWEDWE